MKFINAKNLGAFSMGEFTDDMGDEYRNYVHHTLNLSLKTIKASLSYMQKFFFYAEKKKWCASNPFEKVERLDKKQFSTETIDEVEKYEPLEIPELEAINNHFNAIGERNYWRFVSVILHAFIRPKEIARLKVKDIILSDDPNECFIMLKKGNTKNKIGGSVQITPPLAKLFREMKLEKYSPDDFVFQGANGQRYNKNAFTPGKVQLTENYPSSKWNDLVKKPIDKGGLNIQKDQYGLKHTGNILYLQQNKNKVNMKWLQRQNGMKRNQ
jgi:integrase